MFANIPAAPPDSILGLTEAFKKDSNPKKVNLGGKTLEQFLEQLRVAVLLREREGAALRAYLRGTTG